MKIELVTYKTDFGIYKIVGWVKELKNCLEIIYMEGKNNCAESEFINKSQIIERQILHG